MNHIELKKVVNGCLVNSHVGVTIFSDGRIKIQSHEIFYFMTVDSQSLPYPIYTQTNNGANMEFSLIWLDDQLLVQITIEDEEPLYCNKNEFDFELSDSLNPVIPF